MTSLIEQNLAQPINNKIKQNKNELEIKERQKDFDILDFKHFFVLIRSEMRQYINNV